ncbi:hypothetical protein YK56LOC_70940 [Caballeronia sp. HLA56]
MLLNDSGVLVAVADHEKEVVDFRKAAIGKTEGLPVAIESVDIGWEIWRRAQMILTLRFKTQINGDPPQHICALRWP